MGVFKLPTVSIARFDNGHSSGCERGVIEALSFLGGLERYVLPGQKVFLKPDLMLDYPGDSGQTTRPELVAAVGRMVKALGAEVIVGDSPFVWRGSIDSFWQKTGMKAMAETEGLKLANLEMAGSRPVPIDTSVYYISRVVFEADVVINIPRLKRDTYVGLAGGVRNLLGTVPGFQKGRLFGKTSNGKDFAAMLVDVFAIVKPTLTIMEVPGFNGRPYVTNGSGFVMTSVDTVAIDAVAGEILDLQPEKVHTTRLAGEAGLGISFIEGIRLEGESLVALKRQFRRPSRRGKRDVLKGLTRGAVRPYVWMKSLINQDLCGGCGACVSCCPTRALQIRNGSRTPSINYDLCINCWAGLANCPVEAIAVEPSRWVQQMFPEPRTVSQVF